ncbi:MAG: ABC transporter permease [Microthrixaceae bacterium]
MTAFIALTRAQWHGYWRDKQNWFWMLAFPLMFLVLFGSIFRDASSSKSTLAQIGDVALFGHLPADAKEAFDQLFEVTRFDDEEDAIEQVRNGDFDAAVRQDATTIHLFYSQADQTSAAQVRGAMSAFIDGTNLAVAGVEPAYTLSIETVEDAALSAIQVMTPGLLGWAVAMGATFGAAMPFVTWRTSKLLRRIRLAPVSTEAIIASRLLVSIVAAMLQMVVFVGVGMAMFDLSLTGSWYMTIPLILCATLAFSAIGMIAGAIASTAEAASGLANVIVLPMAFLSGSFLPLDGAPSWMVTISKFLPLGQLNRGMLDVMVRGQGPSAALGPMVALLGFAAVFGLIAARMFRWGD